VGSYRYMSPERLHGYKYDASGDVWSVGVTILQIWAKEYPFIGVSDTPIDLIGELTPKRMDKLFGAIKCSTMMKQFLRATLELEPNRRPNCSELLTQYKWFESAGVRTLLDAQHVVAEWLNTEHKISPSKSNYPNRFDTKYSTLDNDLTDSAQIITNQYHGGEHYYNPKFPLRDYNEINISMDAASHDPGDGPESLSMTVDASAYGRGGNGSGGYGRNTISPAEYKDDRRYAHPHQTPAYVPRAQQGKESKYNDDAMEEEYYSDDFHEEDNNHYPSSYGGGQKNTHNTRSRK